MAITSAPPTSQKVTYRGLVFTRYPESEHRHLRVYFWPTKTQRERGVGALHVEVYRHEVGDIPPGWHVHHRDHDPLNNAASNLEALPAGEHAAHHAEEAGGWGRFDDEHMDRMRVLAAEWHRSPEGRAWHREHAREVWENAERRPVGPCTGCGETIESYRTDERDRWCSRLCFMNHAYRTGRYAKPKVCEECGETFMAKTPRIRFCDKRCSAIARCRKIRETKAAQA